MYFTASYFIYKTTFIEKKINKQVVFKLLFLKLAYLSCLNSSCLNFCEFLVTLCCLYQLKALVVYNFTSQFHQPDLHYCNNVYRVCIIRYPTVMVTIASFRTWPFWPEFFSVSCRFAAITWTKMSKFACLFTSEQKHLLPTLTKTTETQQRDTVNNRIPVKSRF